MLWAPLRTMISLAFVGTVVWCAFTVDLGERTLAQHVDRISRTPEAQDLMDGTRERVTPVVEDLKGRVLGERIEAPTYLAASDEPVGLDEAHDADDAAAESPYANTRAGIADDGARGESRPVGAQPTAAAPSTADRTRLPGQR